VGEHDGVVFYTIGQRHGLKLSAPLPYYVAEKDVASNTIVVGEGPADPALYRETAEIAEVSWVGSPPQAGERLAARIRYRQPAQPLTVIGPAAPPAAGDGRYSGILKNPRIRWRFRFDEPQRAVTPGQSLVLYDGDRVVGGGVIA
jgi:tRNA-specific 2-thiouridylase